MAGHSVDEYLETIYFLAFPIGEYRPDPGSSTAIASRVADMLGVSRASAGEMLKRLEADGLVRRSQSDADRRTVHVTLTDEGARRFEGLARGHEAEVDRIFRALADATRRDILRRTMAGEASVSQLAGAYDMSFAAVQKHVAVLERAHLVTKRKDGRAQRVARQPGFATVLAGQVDQDRIGIGQGDLAILDHRNLAERVHGQKCGLLVRVGCEVHVH